MSLENSVNNCPLVGTYKSKVNSNNQIVLPKELREIFVERQGKEDIYDCRLYISQNPKNSNSKIIKENLTKKEFPKYERLNLGKEYRFVVGINAKKVEFVSHGDYVELIRD